MFITLEGIEGSGKTTQIRHIADFLAAAGYSCVTTKEPGGTPVGERIRAILLDPWNEGLHPLAELLLYSADRVQHIREVIVPALDEGRAVICDRFHDSTTVYQGVSRGVDMRWLKRLHSMVLGNLEPDITFILDLPADKGLERAWKQIKGGIRSESETRFERENLEFHEKVRQGYLKLARSAPGRVVVVDASLEEVRVAEAIRNILKQRFNI